jgi:glycosyltransferase involved in cell wall biosynthesis
VAKRIAFVPPRFGLSVVGGSEAVSREAAIGFAGRGWSVEVLTTCAVDHYTWANVLPLGLSEEDGVVVRRFPTVHTPSRVAQRAEQLISANKMPSLDSQVSWLSFRFQVPDLFHHLLRYGHDYDAIVFSPYLFWTTAVCLPIVADRAVIKPCLHDEWFARLDVLRPILRAPRLAWFSSEPEHELAHRLGPLTPNHAVTGEGIRVPATYDPEGFRERYGLHRPFLLYAGRREPGKGWDWLLDAFAYTVRTSSVDVDLVTIGVGTVDPPSDVSDRVVDLGFISSDERDSALAAASAYVQPSRLESFSRTIMESWLAGTPVLAKADGEVVAWHCRRSGGGLLFLDQEEFSRCVQTMCDQPGQMAELARRGRQYVLDEYSWDAVLDRMEAGIETLA